MSAARPGVTKVLYRGIRKLCPNCGGGPVFQGWYTLRPSCPSCRYGLTSAEGDTWAFMYISTAFVTGLIIVGMLLIQPANLWLGRAVVLGAAMVAIVGTLPRRKALGLAIDYLLEQRGRRAGELEVERALSERHASASVAAPSSQRKDDDATELTSYET